MSPDLPRCRRSFYDKNGNGLLGIDEIKEMVVAECGYQDDADTARFCAEVLEDFVRDYGFCVISCFLHRLSMRMRAPQGQYDANDDNNIDPDEFGDLWRYLMKW